MIPRRLLSGSVETLAYLGNTAKGATYATSGTTIRARVRLGEFKVKDAGGRTTVYGLKAEAEALPTDGVAPRVGSRIEYKGTSYVVGKVTPHPHPLRDETSWWTLLANEGE